MVISYRAQSESCAFAVLKLFIDIGYTEGARKVPQNLDSPKRESKINASSLQAV